MIKKEDIQLDTDRTTAIELHHIDLDTQMHLLRISNFLQKHPEIVSISYPSAELLIAEKNIKIRNAAITAIFKEINRRRDVRDKNFRIKNIQITENQVRRILNAERIKENPDIKTVKPQSTHIELQCPFCKKSISYEKKTRSNILSFRTTETVDDALMHLANACGITRSFLVSELLYISQKYGKSL